ncbi:MAG: gamma-glutamylcyclotransferase family protein [Henriciella sp.]|uniref:gamma-glutamylcyclotransferase family protein n=1 Tax=Henriciella sp. TaxID=1968823 RepID=UPI0032ECE4CA
MSTKTVKQDVPAARLYFAYGSNLKTEQLEKRVGPVEPVALARLDDYKLVFNRRGSYRPGGVASIKPYKASTVYGVVFKLGEEAFSKLDEIEDPAAYERVPLTVTTEDGKPLRCQTYVAFPQGYFPPSPAYLDIIREGAREHGLPPDYVRALGRRQVLQEAA